MNILHVIVFFFFVNIAMSIVNYPQVAKDNDWNFTIKQFVDSGHRDPEQ